MEKQIFETYPQCEQYDINDDNRVSAWDFLILTLQYGRDGFDTCGAGIAPAQIAKTGQNTCYDSGGVEINCLDTGQDGEYQKGVIGPSPRFTDHGDGTITDNLTGLMWTQNAQQVSGTKTWSEALTACNDLDHATHTDWRLPNERELHSLIDYSEYNPPLPSGHPFLNVMSDYYWTSTTDVNNSNDASAISTKGGSMMRLDKIADPSYAWCIRGETNGPAPVTKTGQTISYATGDDGDLQMGAAWPNPRFTDNEDETVTDNLTGLMWTKNANLPVNDETWQQALDYVAGMNTANGGEGTYGYNDWRLPNTNELLSLIDLGQYLPALSSGHPFTNVVSGLYWSSTTYEFTPSSVWSVYMGFGGAHLINKSNSRYVWPVRRGQ